MEQFTDPQQVVIEFRAGNKDAFGQIYLDLYGRVRFFVQQIVRDKEEAQDITSEAFLSLWHARSSLDNATSIKAYVYTIARNSCYKYLNKKKINLNGLNCYGYFIATSEEPIIELITVNEIMAKLEEEIQDLPPQCKEVIEKIIGGQFTLQEIAHQLDTTYRTIVTQKMNGTKRLAEKMKIFREICEIGKILISILFYLGWLPFFYH